MKLVKNYFLFLLIWLPAGAILAQNTCTSSNPPACTFVAIDVATDLTVEAFCVGRGVRFEPCPGRNVPTSLLYYGVLPGVGTTYINTTPQCTPPKQLPYTYTPQASDVGMATVSELTNNGAQATYYIRTYRVFATPPPTFTIAPCPGTAAFITVTDVVYDTYTVQLGAGPTQPIVRNRATVVAVPVGATTVTITGKYTANGVCEGAAIQPIPTLAPPQIPAFTRLNLQAPLPGGTATLEVGQLPAGYTYTLQTADASVPGGYRTVAPVAANTSSITLNSVVAGCYRLRRVDPCRLDSAFSPLLCTLSLSGASSQNRNQLLLSDAGSGSTYSVTRNGAPVPGLTAITGGLEDPNVECGTTYTYRVTATRPGGGASVSNPVSIITQSARPPAQPQLLASFNLRNVVELTPLLANGAALTSGSSLRYRRTAAGQLPTDFRISASSTVQRDSTAFAELLAQTPCYSVLLVDVCGNSSPESSAACPSLLTATAADPIGATTLLTWTAFGGPSATVPAVYFLQRLRADGTVLNTVPASGSSFADLAPPTDQQVLRYRLQISGAGLPPGTFSYSNVTTVERQPAVTIPTAFTPNGDGLNDLLEVKGRYLQSYTFTVVDRNGQVVFRSTQRSETWDGTIKGRAPVPGTYAWRFQQQKEDGTPFTATGSVSILK